MGSGVSVPVQFADQLGPEDLTEVEYRKTFYDLKVLGLSEKQIRYQLLLKLQNERNRSVEKENSIDSDTANVTMSSTPHRFSPLPPKPPAHPADCFDKLNKYLDSYSVCEQCNIIFENELSYQWHQMFAKPHRCSSRTIEQLPSMRSFTHLLFSKPKGYMDMSPARRRWVDAIRTIIKRRAVEQTRSMLAQNAKQMQRLEMIDSKISLTPSLMRQLISDGRSLSPPRKGIEGVDLELDNGSLKLDNRIAYEPNLLRYASKFFWKWNINVDIHVYFHDPAHTLLPMGVVEITAYDSTHDRELPRVYLDHCRTSRLIMSTMVDSHQVIRADSISRENSTESQPLSRCDSMSDTGTCFSESSRMSRTTSVASMPFNQALAGSRKGSFIGIGQNLTREVYFSVEDFVFARLDVQKVEQQSDFALRALEDDSETDDDSEDEREVSTRYSKRFFS
jgi:hypothetical protein